MKEMRSYTHLKGREELADVDKNGMKVKVKFPPCFNSGPRHEGVLGNGVTAPRLLDLGTRWR
jgi:hypothetical protein